MKLVLFEECILVVAETVQDNAYLEPFKESSEVSHGPITFLPGQFLNGETIPNRLRITPTRPGGLTSCQPGVQVEGSVK